MEWQPIETAKKNTDWILLGYFPDHMEGKCLGGQAVIAYWDGYGWVDSCGRKLRKDRSPFSPTHWMPLPNSPKL